MTATEVQFTPSPTVVLDMRGAKRNISHYISMSLWIGWLHVDVVLFSTLLLLAVLYPFIPSSVIHSNFPPILLFKFIISSLLFLVITSLFLPIDRRIQPKICYQFGDWLVRQGADYFNVKVVMENEKLIRTNSPCIFSCEPHDVLPISLFVFNDSLKAILGHRCAGLVSSACFKVPIVRHVWTWAHAYSIDKKNILRLLNEGVSPVLCPGGAHEVAYLESVKKSKEYILYLSKRSGFVKIAFQQGVPIVPVFSFGLQNSFDFYVIQNKTMQNIGRKFGFLPMLYFGLFGTVFGPPKPCDYTVVIGKPILITKKLNPTDEEVKEVLNNYIEEMITLFNKHKADYNMGDYIVKVI